MKKLLFLFILNLTGSLLFSNPLFDDYFESGSLRIDYYHGGTNETEFFFIDELIKEPNWGGSKVNLIDVFDYGLYKYELYDKESDKLIYSKGYSTLFGEWQYTEEAKKYPKTFSESLLIPYPKKVSIIKIFKREKNMAWREAFVYEINPSNYFIVKEQRIKSEVYKVKYSGEPENHVDIVIIPDGYTKEEMDKFVSDSKRFAESILNTDPFSKNKEKINIYAVKTPSPESGTDFPGLNVWKNTLVNASFYTFDSERYLMTTDNKSIRNVAANAPYDQIFILVNTSHYGGGGIYNFYSTAAADNEHTPFLITHEFGHAFAGLADEYYTSDVSVENFYDLNAEPWEPNITTMIHFDNKWKSMMAKDTPIPTPATDEYKNAVGVFEGGGYVAKGVYRPAYDCTMQSVRYNFFCPVCQNAIQKMIDFYSK